jgi:DNA 3'-phosphatase
LFEQFFDTNKATLLNSFRPSGYKIKVAIFDADGTVRITKSGAHTARDDKDVVILPNVADKMKQLSNEGYFIAIMSNQLGVGAGVRSFSMIDHSLNYTASLLQHAGGIVHYYDFAINQMEGKPSAFMATKLENFLKKRFGSNYEIDYSRSLMVGDAAYKEAKADSVADLRPDGSSGTDFNNFDRLFAETLKIDFFEPDKFFGWDEFGVNRIKSTDDLNLFK